MESLSDIQSLFKQTGIHNPTDIQIKNVVALLEGTIENGEAFLKAGIEAVKSIRRWRGLNGNMKTTDTVGEHQNRVENMIPVCGEIIVIVFGGFDFRKASFMAKHHDMNEGLSPLGDIPTPLKVNLSPTLKGLLKKVEMACLEILATMDSGEYDMDRSAIRESLLEMEDKQTPEAQIVKYFDLLDAYMMSIHEYSLGTMEFLGRVGYYHSIFQKIYTGDYLPFIKELQYSIYSKSNNNTPAQSLLDIATLSTLKIDPELLLTNTAYKFWRDHIAML